MNWRPLRLVASLKIICLLGVSCAAPQARVQAPPTVKSTSTTNQVPSRITTTEHTVVPSQSAYQPSAAIEPSRPPLEPSPGSLAYLDFKNGFRDLKFGDSPTNDMVLKEDGGDSKYYFRPRDELTIGRAHMDRLVYGFYKNRLAAVLINTKGLWNSRALLDVLRQAYGYGSQPNEFMQRYTWRSARVIISYDGNSITRDASVWFFSIPLTDEEKADKEREARKGVSGL
jgi:hypothetical protein